MQNNLPAGLGQFEPSLLQAAAASAAASAAATPTAVAPINNTEQPPEAPGAPPLINGTLAAFPSINPLIPNTNDNDGTGAQLPAPTAFQQVNFMHPSMQMALFNPAAMMQYYQQMMQLSPNSANNITAPNIFAQEPITVPNSNPLKTDTVSNEVSGAPTSNSLTSNANADTSQPVASSNTTGGSPSSNQLDGGVWILLG